MKVLITGGGGFLGSRVVAQALHLGHPVLAVGRASGPSRRLAPVAGHPHFSYRSVDVSAFEALRTAAEAFAPEVMIHAAAPAVLRRDPSSAHGILGVSMGAATEVARVAGLTNARVIWIGSGGEYAPSEKPISEDASTEPTTLYGVAKNLAWRAFKHLARVSHVTLRPFQLYGPGEDEERFVPAALLAPSGRAPNAFGNAEIVRDFVYVDDVATAILSAADRLLSGDNLSAPVLNLGSGTGTSLKDVARLASDVSGFPSFQHRFEGRPPLAGFDDRVLVADVAAAAAALSWRATTSLAEGLRRTLAWLDAERSK